jgi:hypothetical protein
VVSVHSIFVFALKCTPRCASLHLLNFRCGAWHLPLSFLRSSSPKIATEGGFLSVTRVRLFFACLLLAASALALAQTQPPLPPPNPLLENHKKWFLPAEVWDIQTDPRLAAHRPKGLTYTAYSAVGYNLANTIAVRGTG